MFFYIESSIVLKHVILRIYYVELTEIIFIENYVVTKFLQFECLMTKS